MRYSYVTVILLSLVFSVSVFSNMESENTSSAALIIEVINKTTDGTPVTNDEVIVQIFQHKQLLSTLEGKISDDGRAVFENVPTGEHIIVLPRAKHNEMMFTGEVVELIPTEEKFITTVEVFDVSTDKSKLSVDTHHVIISTSPETKTLMVTEFMQLVNSSDMAISSDEKDNQGNPIVLDIMLPEGFSNLHLNSYFEERAIIITDNGFYDTMAVPPGSYQATFSYTLDIASSTMDIVKKISLPTSNLMVFVEGQAQLHGPENIEKKIMNRGGVSMEYLKFNNLAQAEEISFQVTELALGKNDWITWIILAGVFCIIIIFAIIRSANR